MPEPIAYRGQLPPQSLPWSVLSTLQPEPTGYAYLPEEAVPDELEIVFPTSSIYPEGVVVIDIGLGIAEFEIGDGLPELELLLGQTLFGHTVLHGRSAAFSPPLH